MGLNGVIAYFSRYEQNTTKIPLKYKVLHTIYTPYANLKGDRWTDGWTDGKYLLNIQG